MANVTNGSRLSATTIDAPQDSDNDFLCAVQLQRIANSLETIIDMIKKDQEESKKRWEKETIGEQSCWARKGPHLNQSLALAPGARTELQAPSRKLQASSRKLDKKEL